MARTVRDAKLETRAARGRLEVKIAPYWKTLEPGKLHLGYRKRRGDAPGVWLVRRYVGLDTKNVGRYRTETLPGLADDYRDADGEGVLSFAQAQKAAHQRAAARSNDQRDRPELTVADAIADYISYLRTERKTATDAEQRARTLILPELGALPVAALTTGRLLRWRDGLAAMPARLRTRRGGEQNYRGPPASDEDRRARQATTNRTMTILKAALNRAHTLDRVADDLAWRRLKPFREAHAARTGHLSLADSVRLINGSEPAFRQMVHAALQTGCRYGELAALRVSDFAGGKVAVRTSKSGWPRHVRLTDEGDAFFRQVTAGRAADELMFARADGSPWTKNAQSRPMAAACAAARIKPVGFHQLRHTWASLAVMNGVPLLVVSHNLGHRDTRMVEKHYGHLSDTYVDEAIRSGAPRFGALEPAKVTVLRP